MVDRHGNDYRQKTGQKHCAEDIRLSIAVAGIHHHGGNFAGSPAFRLCHRGTNPLPFLRGEKIIRLIHAFPPMPKSPVTRRSATTESATATGKTSPAR